jgi:hypothetical protein
LRAQALCGHFGQQDLDCTSAFPKQSTLLKNNSAFRIQGNNSSSDQPRARVLQPQRCNHHHTFLTKWPSPYTIPKHAFTRHTFLSAVDVHVFVANLAAVRALQEGNDVAELHALRTRDLRFGPSKNCSSSNLASLAQ